MYDVVVAGLGAMGSAVAAQCAARGARLLAVDRFACGHDLGASSGKTRIIRQAYFENSAYVPILLRAYELWRDLERLDGRSILSLTGLLLCGRESGLVIEGSRLSARRFDLPVRYFDTPDLRAAYPMLRIQDDEVGVFERQGGAVFPEIAIDAFQNQALARGAELRFGITLENWDAREAHVDVALSDGSRIRARTLILALGPWFAEVMRDLGVDLRIQRNVQVWFEPSSSAYGAQTFPAFLLERGGLPAALYGFPDFGDGVKAAFHGRGELTAPDALRRDIDPQVDVAPLAAAMEEWMPGSSGPLKFAKACMYSLTPDEHFVIDLHPAHANVVICGGFSGHGFKFASVVGEIGADLALTGGTRHDVEFLSARRFGKTPSGNAA